MDAGAPPSPVAVVDAAIVDASPEAAGPDVDAVVARLRERFGANARIAIESEFVLVAGDRAAPVGAAAELTRRTLAAFLDGSRFGRRPSYAVPVIVFSTSEGLRAYLGPDAGGIVGAYDRSTHSIAFDTSAGKLPTLSHEIAHALMHYDWGERSAPTWFDECVATVFENPRWPADGGIEGEVHGHRLARAQGLVRAGARLDDVFAITNASFKVDSQSDRNEALARYTCLWLQSRGQLWPFYRSWREGWDDDRIGAETFERVTGMTPHDASDSWRSWVLSLR